MALLDSAGKQLNVKQLQATSLTRDIQGKGVSFNYTQYFKDRRCRFRCWQQRNPLSTSLPNIEQSVKDKSYKRRSEPFGAKRNGWFGMLQRRKTSLEQEQHQIPDDQIPDGKKKIVEEFVIHDLPGLYDELISLTTKAKHYANAHKCICNSLSREIGRMSREEELVMVNWQANRNIIEGNEQIQCNRQKLSNVFDEILELSLKIKRLVCDGDKKSSELLLCQNICCAANIFTQHIASRVSEESDLLLRQSRNFTVKESRVSAATHSRLPYLLYCIQTYIGIDTKLFLCRSLNCIWRMEI